MMYVRPEYRGQGLNAVVLEELVSLAKERGITEVYLEVYSQNQSAIRAYEKFGFENYMVQMRLNLE